MSLRVVYTDDFPADVGEQARWYARQRMKCWPSGASVAKGKNLTTKSAA